jgi:flagella basal body P-ring formation protein FlgA
MTKIFFILTCILGLAQTAAALQITFNSHCSVYDSVVKLGDVAVFDEETEMTRALATLPISQAPSPGEKNTLRSVSIKEYLISSQSLSQDISWKGSPTVTVLRRGIDIGPETISTIIDEYIAKNAGDLPEAEIRFVPESLPLPFTLQEGGLTHEIIPSNPGILASSRFSIIFRIDGKVVKNISVRGKMEALTRVVVSSGPLKRGQILEPQDVTTAVMDISAMNNPGLDMEDFIGKKLQRSIRAGSPIYFSMVAALPLVRRGERVKIVINSGPLHITATGLARSDGLEDEMIRVQNISSNKIIHCRVAAPGLVEVIL